MPPIPLPSVSEARRMAWPWLEIDAVFSGAMPKLMSLPAKRFTVPAPAASIVPAYFKSPRPAFKLMLPPAVVISDTTPTMLMPVVEPPKLLMFMSPLAPVVLILTEPSLLPLLVKFTPNAEPPLGAVPLRVIGPVTEVSWMRLLFPELDMPDPAVLVVVPEMVIAPEPDVISTVPVLS